MRSLSTLYAASSFPPQTMDQDGNDPAAPRLKNFIRKSENQMAMAGAVVTAGAAYSLGAAGFTPSLLAACGGLALSQFFNRPHQAAYRIVLSPAANDRMDGAIARDLSTSRKLLDNIGNLSAVTAAIVAVGGLTFDRPAEGAICGAAIVLTNAAREVAHYLRADKVLKGEWHAVPVVREPRPAQSPATP